VKPSPPQPSSPSPKRRRVSNGPVIWMACLIFSICFEGQARKYFSAPDALFYFLKDAVLLAGLPLFGIRRDVLRSAAWAYGPFVLALAAAFLWTFMQTMNPDHRSFVLAAVGMRSYWLWWLAPLIIASALREPEQRDRVVAVLIVTCLAIAGFAFLQFARPADDPINAYAWSAEETAKDMEKAAVVGTTKRARVSSTFSYITGFTNFTVLVPGLLLALALGQAHTWIRGLGFLAVILMAIATPMSGSRSPIVLSGIFITIVVLTAGVLRSRAARRAVLAAAIALPLAVVVAPQAVEGLSDRFGGSDTESRLLESLYILPPVAVTSFDYPVMGLGTGMEQNARVAMGIPSPYHVEAGEGRYLVELGVLGYLLFWLARLGLVLALIKAGLFVRRSGRLGIAGACFGYAALTMFGRMAFDHVWAALYFTGMGFFLYTVHAVRMERAIPDAPALATTGPLWHPPPVSRVGTPARTTTSARA
jgi:hypothetical protein